MINGTDSSTEKNLNDIISLISEKTGNNFRETHKIGITRYIEKRIGELKLSYQDYFPLIKNDNQEIFSLINASTVNETYFFREEKQFVLLKKLLSAKDEVNIWSAACSSGEEIYSVKLLCDSMNVKSSLFASDINTDKLNLLKKGKYNKKQSTREIDGKIFHELLEPYSKGEQIEFSPEICNSFENERINLIDFESYKVLGQKKFDMILIRNVFIYFSLEERYTILNYIAENYLVDDGYIFVSLSETALLEEKYLSSKIEKICVDDIFLFHKVKTQETEVEYE